MRPLTPSSTERAPALHGVDAFLDSCCTALMRSAISLVEAPARSARFLISSATTAKPLPCSPACAAMMAAVQREEVGLLGDVVDDLEDLADLADLRVQRGDDADRLFRTSP